MNIKIAGVVGCGQMGSGIAHLIAQSGYQTIVLEANREILDRGFNGIKASLARSVEKGKLSTQEGQAIFARLKGATNAEDLAVCDIVIEAIVEDLQEKKLIFAALDAVCPPHAILASNTSTLSVTDIAAATGCPERVVGMHFFFPAPVMKLVEVVSTTLSTKHAAEAAEAFAVSLGKSVVNAKDTPGFIVNRLLVPYILDAIRMYESGAATKEDIDQAMVLGCNHPMGPLALIDMLGLDILYSGANSFYRELKDPRFTLPVVVKRMVSAGELGRKSGKGFYDYRQARLG